MTDKTTPTGITPEEAKKAREWALHALNKPGASTTAEKAVARVILSTVPTPERPTLADMCDEERHACRWMQADVENRSVRYVIANPCDAEGDAALIAPYGEIEWFSPDRVTPRPDLPPLELPGDKKPTPALPDGWRLADHDVCGRVVVTTQTPNSDGNVYVVLPVGQNLMGFDWRSCDPDELTYIDQDAPDANTVKEGDVIESADDPRLDALPTYSALQDRDGDVVVKGEKIWAGDGYPPIPYEGDEFGPWTVLHIPKRADQ